MESPSEGSTANHHARKGSGRVIRRSTRGPLDIDDSPLQPDEVASPTSSVFPLPTHQQQLLSPISLSSNQSQFASPRLSSPRATPRLPSPTPGSNVSNQTYRTAPSHQVSNMSNYQNPQKDFGYLLRPEIYHPLTLLDVPPPFRVSSLQPSTDTPLESLISGGHFRSAAIKAAQLLTSSGIAPSDHEAIFSLIYTRLSCLTLCNATALAAQEVKALEDLNSSYYLDDLTGAHLAPWELRVLAVRLQGMGFNDARRGVMGYYELGREARLTLTALKKAGRDQNAAEIAMWDARLQDLGLRVASALIEMEDLEGAARHLKTLRVDNGRLRAQQALLWLYLGDVDAARKCIAAGADEQARDVILALACMGDAEYAAAVPIWERLIEAGSGGQRDDVEIAMYRQNLAVCLLYLGQLSLTRTHLESLIDAGHSWRGLTFNLATVYELCTERSRALKISLVERVAGLREEGRGSEGVNGDFKL